MGVFIHEGSKRLTELKIEIKRLEKQSKSKTLMTSISIGLVPAAIFNVFMAAANPNLSLVGALGIWIAIGVFTYEWMNHNHKTTVKMIETDYQSLERLVVETDNQIDQLKIKIDEITKS